MTTKMATAKNHIHHPIKTPIKKARIAPQKSIHKIAGCLSSEDATELKNIIEKDCERIDNEAWKNLN
jgi:hypothetical protein